MLGLTIPNPVNHLSSSKHFTHIQEEDTRKFYVITIACFMALLIHITLIPTFVFIGVPELALVNIGSVTAWLVALYLNFKGKHNPAIYIVCTEVLAHSLIATAYLGTAVGFQHYLWAIAGLAIINSFMTIPVASVHCFLFIVAFALSYILFGDVEYAYRYAEYMDIVHFVNILIAGIPLTLSLITVRYITVSHEQRLNQLATIDSLTKLYNRRFITEMSGKYISQSITTNSPLSLALCDIDFFKRINDQFGHHEGDLVLQKLAEFLQLHLKPTDIIACWGGEEFLIVMPDTNGDAAHKRLDNVRLAVYRESNLGSSKPWPISVSVGVTQWQSGDAFEDCLKLADDALYRSKKKGRNQVTLLHAKNMQYKSETHLE